MTGCVFCGADIMRVGDRWYKARVADVNGFCPNSPTTCITPSPMPKLKGRKGKGVSDRGLLGYDGRQYRAYPLHGRRGSALTVPSPA